MSSKLIDRVIFGGYETAKENATIDIVARISRGNTTIQNGHLLDDADIDELRGKSARAMRRLAWLRKLLGSAS